MMGLARSTYYYQRKQQDHTDLLLKMEAIVIEFPKYGYRRVTKALHRLGILINHKVILKLMREKGWLCRQKRSFVVKTTDSNHPYPVFPNRIKHLVVTRLNQVWVSDITYVRLYRGFAYLAAILDKLSRKVVGYAMSLSITRELTLAALKMAVQARRPTPGCIHHSDRGVQYAAHEYVDYLREQKFEISMSAKGNPYDNAVAESFMKTYKYDEVYLSDYESFGEALQNTGRFIDDVYNAKRLHSSLGYVPPNEFEENWLRQQGYVLTLPGSGKCLLTNLNAENSAENLEKGGILATI
jgi:transposase InsO family protein